MNSNGPLGNYHRISKEHIIRHVLREQNGGSTTIPLFDKDHKCKDYDWEHKQ